MKKILITGGPGFAASHLIKYIRQQDEQVEIHATKRVRSDMYRVDRMALTEFIHWHLIELTDAHSVFNVIRDVMPNQIYHLAAQDYVKSSWDSPKETFDTNVNGLINLYNAIRRLYPRVQTAFDTIGDGKNIPLTNIVSNDVLSAPKVLVTSTSETYGYCIDPIHELTEMKPRNPYGISKMTMDHLARLYASAYDIPTVVTRSFNITGWGRNDPFVDSNFARQIAEIENKVNAQRAKGGYILHGNLNARRSFFDVRDAVRGYYLAMNYDSEEICDVFCFGPEHSTSIDELLDMMIDMSTADIKKQHDSSRDRPIDTPDMRCDATKAKRLLKWEPQVSLENSIANLLDYWRERL